MARRQLKKTTSPITAGHASDQYQVLSNEDLNRKARGLIVLGAGVRGTGSDSDSDGDTNDTTGQLWRVRGRFRQQAGGTVPLHTLLVQSSTSTGYGKQACFEQEVRRGGISYEQADKNAAYVRALGDGRMGGKAVIHHRKSPLLDWERALIDRACRPDNKIRFRCRFFSMHRVRRRRQPHTRLTAKNKHTIDDFYHLPAQLLVAKVGNWDFDCFHLDTLTGGRPLLHLAVHVFKEYNFVQHFNLDTIRLVRFFASVEDSYHDSNPYHNNIHATDVLQAMFCYLQEDKLLQSVPMFEVLIALVAAMCHDLDHPGVNQTFMVATANHLATLYQNTSVLENHHWRYGVGLMQDFGIFSHFTNSQWAAALWQFRSLILATDITRQQEFLLKFRKMIDEQEFDYETNINTRHFILQIALKCADICNPCRKWPLSERWSRKVCEEFFRQGDMERRVGVQVTPVCDRHANTVAKVQIGFMEMVVKPLFVEWKRFLPSQLSDTMLANIANNKRQWQGVEEKGGLARPTKLTLSPSPGVSSSCGDRARDGNANNATTATTTTTTTTTTAAKQVDEAEMEEEEEGEEEDTLENDVNLAFHYQTDSELRSGDGTYTLPPMSEEEQLRRLALNTRRRHSMPVAVRKDLGFYLGLQRDGLATSGSGSGSGLGAVPGYLRRQSLPVAPVLTSMLDPVLGKDLCVDKLRARPKIFNLSSALGTGTPHPPPFIHRLQQGGEGGGLGPGDDHPDTALLPPPRPRQMSASCVELQRDLEGLRSGVMGRGGHRGFASSWPNVTQAGRQMKQDDVDSDLLLQRPDLPSHQGSSHSRNSEPGDSGSDRDVSAGVSSLSIRPGDSGSDRDVSAGVSSPSIRPGDSGSDRDVSAGVSSPCSVSSVSDTH